MCLFEMNRFLQFLKEYELMTQFMTLNSYKMPVHVIIWYPNHAHWRCPGLASLCSSASDLSRLWLSALKCATRPSGVWLCATATESRRYKTGIKSDKPWSNETAPGISLWGLSYYTPWGPPSKPDIKLNAPAPKGWQIMTSMKSFVRFWGGADTKQPVLLQNYFLSDFEGGGGGAGSPRSTIGK